jgi:hypothetical protein
MLTVATQDSLFARKSEQPSAGHLVESELLHLRARITLLRDEAGIKSRDSLGRLRARASDTQTRPIPLGKPRVVSDRRETRSSLSWMVGYLLRPVRLAGECGLTPFKRFFWASSSPEIGWSGPGIRQKARWTLEMNSSLFRRSTDQIACDMGGEVVILHLKSGMYYGLDPLGAKVWTLIEQPAPLSAIRDLIMSEYDVDAETCDRDILAFLDQMKAVGLVEISHSPISRMRPRVRHVARRPPPRARRPR